MGRAEDLQQLAETHFAPLSKSEIKILQSAVNGTTAFCGLSEQDDDPGNDPADSDNWSADRQIRSDLIRWLCIHKAAKAYVDPRGVQVHGARVNGALDLSFATVTFPIRFSRCRLSDDWNLNYVEVPSIQLTGSQVRSLTADIAKVKGSVFMNGGFRARGKVQLRGAQIGGNLNCEGSEFRNRPDLAVASNSIALDAEDIKVVGSILLSENTRTRVGVPFRAEGGVRLFNAEIGGNLDCAGGKFQNPARAEIPGSGMALHAEGAKVKGSVFVRYNFSAEGEVSFFNAEIGGDLDCGAGEFANPAKTDIPGSGIALNAVGAKIDGSVFMRLGFSADGAVRLFGALVGRSLECYGGKFLNPARVKVPTSGVALDAGIAKIGGPVFLNNNFLPQGEVRLFNAEIGGNLDCGGAKFQNPAKPKTPGSGLAFNAEGVKVGGSVFVRYNFSAEGEVRLFNAEIGGNLDCGGASFQNPANATIPGSGMALNAEGIKVERSVFVRDDFSAEGQVSFFNAEIGGDLDCGGGRFVNPANAEIPGSGMALNAVGAKVDGSVFMRLGFSADGAVRLFGAEIGRIIDCGGGKFVNPAQVKIPISGVALDAELAKIAGPVFLNNNFLPEGEVRLYNAKIGGDLDCGHSEFKNPANAEISGSGVALDGRGINVDGSMLLREEFRAVGKVRLSNARIARSFRCDNTARCDEPPFESLDLIDASVGSIVDHKDSWPAAGALLLDGFVYGRISGGPTDADKRLEWLRRQPSFARQPYRQLASILGNAGDDLGARRVLSEMEHTAWEQRGRPVRLISHLLRFTIGYGYFPLRAIWLLLALVVIGSGVYWMSYRMGSIVPIQKESFTFYEAHCYTPNEYERFHTIPYSLENSFPLVKLGLQDKWAPAPETRVVACCSGGFTSPALYVLSAPRFVRWFRWIQICLGWVLTTLFVGGVTGILRKG